MTPCPYRFPEKGGRSQNLRFDARTFISYLLLIALCIFAHHGIPFLAIQYSRTASSIRRSQLYWFLCSKGLGLACKFVPKRYAILGNILSSGSSAWMAL